MQVSPAALARLRDGQFRSDAICLIFETIAESVQYIGPGSSTLVLDYQSPEDAIAEGDLIPVITLSVRPATLPTP